MEQTVCHMTSYGRVELDVKNKKYSARETFEFDRQSIGKWAIVSCRLTTSIQNEDATSVTSPKNLPLFLCFYVSAGNRMLTMNWVVINHSLHVRHHIGAVPSDVQLCD